MHGPMRGWSGSHWRCRCCWPPATTARPDGAATNTIFILLRRALAALPRSDGVVQQPETPYTYSAYEPLHTLPLPSAALTADPEDGRGRGRRTMSTRRAGAARRCAARADRREHLTTSTSRRHPLPPHPAFAKDDKGEYRYHHLTRERTGRQASPWDLNQGTRELVAEDYVYAFKRHATTRIEAPIYAIFGVRARAEGIRRADQGRGRQAAGQGLPECPDKPFLDFRRWPLAGVTARTNCYTVRFRIKGRYPQWKYWMAMTFQFAGALGGRRLHAQPGMNANGLSLVKWPGGHGPLHDDRVRAGPPARDEAQSRTSGGEPLSLRRHAGRPRACSTTAARPCPSIDTIVVHHRREGGAAQGDVQAGLPRRAEIERPTGA